jgi:phage terminase small subunit
MNPRKSQPLANANERRKRAASGLLTAEELDAEPTRPLNERERLYVQARAQGMTHYPALRAAGYAESSSKAESIFMSRPAIRAALAEEQAKYREQSRFKRDDVLNGLAEAIDQAKIQADPMGQIAGWREIAKICGFYAPETKKIELGGSAQRLLAKFEQLSDAELLQIAEGEVFEGEFTDVTDRKRLTS